MCDVCVSSGLSQIKVWRLPAGGLVADLVEADVTLRGCDGRVTTLAFHPFGAHPGGRGKEREREGGRGKRLRTRV